jgi:arginine deiminase
MSLRRCATTADAFESQYPLPFWQFAQSGTFCLDYRVQYNSLITDDRRAESLARYELLLAIHSQIDNTGR